MALDEEGEPIETTTVDHPLCDLAAHYQCARRDRDSAPAGRAVQHSGVPVWKRSSGSSKSGQLDWNYTDSGPAFRGRVRISTSRACGQTRPTTFSTNGLSAITILRGATLQHRTGVPALSFPPFEVTDAPDILTDRNEDVVVSSVTLGTQPLATTARDLSGNVIWYYYAPPGPNQNAPNLLRPVRAATCSMCLAMATNGEGYRWQILREADLAGNVVRQTSVFSLNLQLEARGDDPITAIHHEAVRMPNGYTAVIGNVEKVVPSTEGDREMLGDMVLVLDENLQVVWTWNGFDHLDTERRAILGETCEGTQGGCPQLVDLVGPAEDWMHSNSLDYTPDGHLLLSVRHQDWVIKINYADGAGDGSILEIGSRRRLHRDRLRRLARAKPPA